MVLLLFTTTAPSGGSGVSVPIFRANASYTKRSGTSPTARTSAVYRRTGRIGASSGPPDGDVIVRAVATSVSTSVFDTGPKPTRAPEQTPAELGLARGWSAEAAVGGGFDGSELSQETQVSSSIAVSADRAIREVVDTN
jgi:hypothetical protein